MLDIPELRERVAPITIDRYHRMIDAGVFDDWKVELLNGLLVEKVSKSPLHQYLVDLLVDLLVTRLRDHCAGTGRWVRQEGPITVGNSEPEPDVSVVDGDRSLFKHRNPDSALLVIEVAISSLVIDRAKAADYAKAGVPEYWIVCPAEGCTEVRRQLVDGHYPSVQTVPATVPVESVELPGFCFLLEEALRT